MNGYLDSFCDKNNTILMLTWRFCEAVLLQERNRLLPEREKRETTLIVESKSESL